MSLAEAVANSRMTVVKELVEDGKTDLDAPGSDGTTPLCAAALWGDADMVKYLLSVGADANARNDGTNWTPLHAAAFQEHAKVVHVLLQNRADPRLKDASGCTPTDYASISEAIWPFFASTGCIRSAKADLVALGIVRKVAGSKPSSAAGREAPAAAAAPAWNSVKHLSRPGSAYIRVSNDPMSAGRGGYAKGREDSSGRAIGGYRVAHTRTGAGGGAPRAPSGPIDPLADDDDGDEPRGLGRSASLRGFGL